MLDNNQFFYTDDKNTSAETWTCYCDHCQKKFRDYAVGRFGAEGVWRVFGVDAAKLTIPTTENALYSLWIHWRNRVWAETNETFRARLRRIEPQIMFLPITNTIGRTEFCRAICNTNTKTWFCRSPAN
jgi:hypothetical protein